MVEPRYSPLSKQGTIFGSVPTPACTFVFTIFLCIFGFYTVHLPLTHTQNQSSHHFQETFLSFSTNITLYHYLHSLTSHPHLAGTQQGHETARYVRTHFHELGLRTHLAEYRVLLSYPLHASISAHFTGSGGVREFSLPEPGLAGSGVIGPYHAYSPSGIVKGKAVFVNYGRDEDYRALEKLGVNLTGCVAIVRRGKGPRSSVVRLAGENGAAAVLTYVEGDKFRDGVERGTVMRGLGDPLSPGWASTVEGTERLSREDQEVKKRFPKIPSMPISAETAEILLQSLEGPMVPREWTGTLKTAVERVGPGPTSINLTYQGEEKMAIIQDVLAIIEGVEEPDRYVLMGNHRDAWTYGAVDPNSGTAALLDIARRFSILMHSGWRPRRTILLCSWDAEEFGMIGSTEWVEQNLLNVGSKAVAYLNVDCAVQGPGFFVSATPQLDNLLVEITKKVKDPEAMAATVYDQWSNMNNGISIMRLSGVDSDFAPFLQHAGVPSFDMYYGKDFPVYHTAYDAFNWMLTYGDPFFHRHVAVVEIWGLLAFRLADDLVLPFNYVSYASELQAYVRVLSYISKKGTVSLDPITESIQLFLAAAKQVEDETKGLQADEGSSEQLVLKRRMLNDRLMLAERGMLDSDGLPSMKWFKHLIYGPSGATSESNLTVFPAIANAISMSKLSMMNQSVYESTIQHEIFRVARAIRRAADALNGLNM